MNLKFEIGLNILQALALFVVQKSLNFANRKRIKSLKKLKENQEMLAKIKTKSSKKWRKTKIKSKETTLIF